MAGLTPLQQSEQVEALIKDYATSPPESAEIKLRGVWLGMLAFWSQVPVQEEVDQAGNQVLDQHSAHYRLCYRLLTAFERVGFGHDEAGERILEAAVGMLLAYMAEHNQERDLFPSGDDGGVSGVGYVAVDLVQAKVIRSAQPITASWSQPIRRQEAKVGRNDPCPCGARVGGGGKPAKYKKCCGRAAGSEIAPAASTATA